MTEKYISPKHLLDGFHCPHCHTYAHQIWRDVAIRLNDKDAIATMFPKIISICARCKKITLWFNENIVYPSSSSAPFPEEDMPNNIKDDFNEARIVVGISPRSASALLRLALQKLMPNLGEKGDSLNDDIGNLVKKGLPVTIQQALDSVRVIGNNAVHPGQIDIKDDQDTALKLFELLNFIILYQITQPNKIKMLFDEKIPQQQKDQIKKRDS